MKMKTPDAAISAQEVTGAAKAALLHAAGMTRGAIAELVAILGAPQAPRNAWLMLFELYRFERQQDQHDDLARKFLQARGETAPAFMRVPGFAVRGVLPLESPRFSHSDLVAIRGHAQERTTVAVDVGAVECLPLELAVALVKLARDLRDGGQRLLLMRATECVAALLHWLQQGEDDVALACPVAPARAARPAPEPLTT